MLCGQGQGAEAGRPDAGGSNGGQGGVLKR